MLRHCYKHRDPDLPKLSLNPKTQFVEQTTNGSHCMAPLPLGMSTALRRDSAWLLVAFQSTRDIGHKSYVRGVGESSLK